MSLLLSVAFTSLFASTVQTTFAIHTACSDGRDNDNDGRVDYPQDDDCETLDDDFEGKGTSGNFITLTDDRDKVGPGGALVYVITLKQQRQDARVVTIDLHLPHQSNIVSASDGGSVSQDHIRWTNVSVYRNVTRTLQVHANVNPNAEQGQYLVARAITEGAEATDTTLVETYVPQPTDVYTVSLSDGREYVTPGEKLTYTARVRNASAQATVNDVRLSLPYETYFVSNSDGGRRDSYSVIWRNVAFNAGETKAFTATVQVDPQAHDRGAIRARASIGSASASDQTIVRVGLPYNSISTALSDGLSTAEKGQVLTYQLRVTNNDETIVGTNVAVDAGLPRFGEFVSATDNGYFDGSNIRWLVTNIAPKETRLLTFKVRIRPDAPVDALLVASAVADGITGSVSRDTTNVVAESSEVSQFDRAPGILFRKTADRGEVLPGGSIRYTLTVRNTLDHVISDAVITDRFDARYMSLEQYDAPHALLSQSNGSMRWKVPVLQPGESWQTSYTLSVDPKAPKGIDLSTVATIRGSDLEDVSLDDRVQTERSDIMEDFPQTGGAWEGIIGSVLSLTAAASTLLQRRRLVTEL